MNTSRFFLNYLLLLCCRSFEQKHLFFFSCEGPAPGRSGHHQDIPQRIHTDLWTQGSQPLCARRSPRCDGFCGEESWFGLPSFRIHGGDPDISGGFFFLKGAFFLISVAVRLPPWRFRGVDEL